MLKLVKIFTILLYFAFVDLEKSLVGLDELGSRGVGCTCHPGHVVCVNSIQCSMCSLWVHKKFSGVRGRLAENPQTMLVQNAVIRLKIDNRHFTPIDGKLLDVGPNFCYLGDMCLWRRQAYHHYLLRNI